MSDPLRVQPIPTRRRPVSDDQSPPFLVDLPDDLEDSVRGRYRLADKDLHLKVVEGPYEALLLIKGPLVTLPEGTDPSTAPESSDSKRCPEYDVLRDPHDSGDLPSTGRGDFDLNGDIVHGEVPKYESVSVFTL